MLARAYWQDDAAGHRAAEQAWRDAADRLLAPPTDLPQAALDLVELARTWDVARLGIKAHAPDPTSDAIARAARLLAPHMTHDQWDSLTTEVRDRDLMAEGVLDPAEFYGMRLNREQAVEQMDVDVRETAWYAVHPVGTRPCLDCTLTRPFPGVRDRCGMPGHDNQMQEAS